MKTGRCSESQIIGILKEVEADAQVKDTLRKYGLADKTYYQWKASCVGINVSELKQWRGIATRYHKRLDSFLAAVHIRCLALWLNVW